VARYRIAIAYRFHFDPRQIDEWTCNEFDHFARACDEIEKENERQRREAEAASRRRR
jgi:hypothetical protein